MAGTVLAEPCPGLRSRGRSAAAEEPGEPRLQRRFRDELLRRGQGRRRGAADFVIEQRLRSVDQHLGRWFAGMDRDKFKPRALLVIQVNVHVLKGTCWGPRPVNRTLVTSALIFGGRAQEGPGGVRLIVFLPEMELRWASLNI